MMRLQRWENGSYFTAFSLHTPGMRVEIGKIYPRCRTPKSDRLLGTDNTYLIDDQPLFLSPAVMPLMVSKIARLSLSSAPPLR